MNTTKLENDRIEQRLKDMEVANDVLHQDGERWREIAAAKHSEGEALTALVRELRDSIGEMMPFVMEDYYPSYASVAYKSAVEKLQAIFAKSDGV
jgi:hypothetical protein